MCDTMLRSSGTSQCLRIYMWWLWWLESVPFSLLGTECRPSFSIVLLLITVLICPNISQSLRLPHPIWPDCRSEHLSFSWKQSMPHLPTAICFCWPCCSACTQSLGDCWASALSLAFCLTYVYDLWAWRRLHLKPWSKCQLPPAPGRSAYSAGSGSDSITFYKICLQKV